MLSLSILLFGNIAFPLWKMNTATANVIAVMLYHNTFCMIRRYLCREKKDYLQSSRYQNGIVRHFSWNFHWCGFQHQVSILWHHVL